MSNSFHGVAFSLIFEKNFFAIGMEEKSSRVISLLNIAGLDDRYLSSVDKLNLNRSINFQLIRKKMDPFIQKSKDYLLSSLNCDYEKFFFLYHFFKFTLVVLLCLNRFLGRSSGKLGLF